jgi:hypothetical protein
VREQEAFGNFHDPLSHDSKLGIIIIATAAASNFLLVVAVPTSFGNAGRKQPIVPRFGFEVLRGKQQQQ